MSNVCNKGLVFRMDRFEHIPSHVVVVTFSVLALNIATCDVIMAVSSRWYAYKSFLANVFVMRNEIDIAGEKKKHFLVHSIL